MVRLDLCTGWGVCALGCRAVPLALGLWVMPGGDGGLGGLQHPPPWGGVEDLGCYSLCFGERRFLLELSLLAPPVGI